MWNYSFLLHQIEPLIWTSQKQCYRGSLLFGPNCFFAGHRLANCVMPPSHTSPYLCNSCSRRRPRKAWLWPFPLECRAARITRKGTLPIVAVHKSACGK